MQQCRPYPVTVVLGAERVEEVHVEEQDEEQVGDGRLLAALAHFPFQYALLYVFDNLPCIEMLDENVRLPEEMDYVQIGWEGHRGILQVEEIQPPTLDVAVPGGQVAMEEAISAAVPVVPEDDVHALLQGFPVLLLETADAIPMAADEAVVVGILEGDVLGRLGDDVAQTFPVECAPLVQRGGVSGLRGGLHEKMYIVHAPTVGHPRHIVHPHAVQLAQHLLLVTEESRHLLAH